MRLRIKVILAVVASLFVATHFLLWVVMSNAGPKILKESLSQHLGYLVSADRVKVSLLSQGVKIKNFALTDPATPNEKPFFTAKTVHLRLNLFALLAKRITIRKMLIYAPALVVWRNTTGQWILPAVSVTKQKSVGNTGTQSRFKQPNRVMSLYFPHLQFKVKFYKLDLRKGEILFFDQTISPPFWVRLKNIQAKGLFATQTLVRFGLTGDVEARNPAAFDIQGECEIRDGKFSSNITAHLNDMDITLLAPYYQNRSPVNLSGGKLSLRSHVRCVDDVLKDSTQEITLKHLKFGAWDKEFLDGKIFGISNSELVDYLEHNKDQINMDFSISGPIQDLKSLPEEETWRMLGLTIANHWLGQNRSQ